MDLSTYYEELQTTYYLSIVALCLAIFAVLFVGIRRIINKEEKTKTKIIVWILTCLGQGDKWNQVTEDMT